LLRDAQCILADEQQARRDLEQKLLLAPRVHLNKRHKSPIEFDVIER
jgi:hypothetical protein